MTGMTLLAVEAGETYVRLTRLASLDQWWHWPLLLLVVGGIVAYVGWMYRKDSAELPRGLGLVLGFLRLAAFGGILFFFLGLEKGIEQRLVKNSRVHVLLDTSLSMGLPQDYSAGEPSPRIDEVTRLLEQGDFLRGLREEHDVVCHRFDQDGKPVEVASLPRLGDGPTELLGPTETETESLTRRLGEARSTALVGGVLLVVAVLSIAMFLLSGAAPRSADSEQSSWSLLTAVVSLIAAVVVLAVASLRCPEASLAAVVGLGAPPEPEQAAQDDVVEETRVNWPEALAPRGVETRLGEAVRFLIAKERGGPSAGVVIVTDGRNNAGLGIDAAVAVAQEANIPLYTVGLGADKLPANARIADLEAPERVYPGDDFSLKGFVQAYGLRGRSVEVQLTSKAADTPDAAETVEETQLVLLGEDGQSVPISFTATPREVGPWEYRLRLSPLAEDRQPEDNSASAKVQVMDDKTKVLLIAGGPTREYQFVRNLLFRDKDTEVHVFLQTGKPGISQEAHEILFDFPTIAAELFEYDCIIAFDPDWLQLDELQVKLLDRWVAEQGGGLIVVAGPVYTPEWTRVQRADQRIRLIRSLYPVTFLGDAAVNLGRVNGDQPWPLTFTRDGEEAKFLWLADDSLDNEKAWADFRGVFGYYAIKDVKDGARVYAHFSDPTEASLDNQQPVFFASQYYGAGRVFFLASGEMWRLREVDLNYFEHFYTKLIRWTSQGRLLRDSDYGVLLVDKDECYLRDQIAVTAILTDSQHQPLAAEQVPAILTQPRGPKKELILRRETDAAREGTYVGYFSPLLAGEYRVEVREPQGDGLLSRTVTAAIPRLETDNATRNDADLLALAQRTRGEYYVGTTAAATPALYKKLEPRDQITYLPGRPDMRFQQLLMTWLMGLICGTLCLEWLIRRLSKLA